MKKMLIFLIILLTSSSIFLSGCNKPSGLTSGDTDKVELVSYAVETQKQYSYQKIGDGFIHSEDAHRYQITGTVKNIAGRYIDQINVTARFYDSDNEYLHSENFYVNYLNKRDTQNFIMMYYNYEENFEVVERVRFVFTVTQWN